MRRNIHGGSIAKRRQQVLSLQGGMGPDADPDEDVVLQAPPDTASPPRRRPALPAGDGLSVSQRESHSQQQQQTQQQQEQQRQPQQQQRVGMTDVARPYPGLAATGPVETRSWVGVLV